jgi:mRNA-degrading endonuclease RelE of RelBE toxin-antitoxin system
MPTKERVSVEQFIQEIAQLKSINEIKNLKKLKGFINAYRIRFGDYRLGLILEANCLGLADIAHRSKFYRVFP